MTAVRRKLAWLLFWVMILSIFAGCAPAEHQPTDPPLTEPPLPTMTDTIPATETEAPTTVPPATQPLETEPLTEPTIWLPEPIAIVPWHRFPLVTDAYYLCLHNRDNKGVYIDEYCHYHIPQISTDGMGAVNTRMAEELYPRMEEVLISVAVSRRDAFFWHMAYLWGQKDDVVSILVGSEYSHSLDYVVYNISLEEKTFVEDEVIYEAFGLTAESYRELLREKAGEAYLYNARNYPVFSVDKEPYASEYAETMSDEFLDQAMLYIGEDGSLCAVLRVRTTAGAGTCWLPVSLTGSAVSDAADPLDNPEVVEE